MDKKQSLKLLQETLKLITIVRGRSSKGKRQAFSEEILGNIKRLSHHFHREKIMKDLSISPSIFYKALKVDSKSEVAPKFIEVKIPPSLPTISSRSFPGKVIVELKTGSGTLITIYE